MVHHALSAAPACQENSLQECQWLFFEDYFHPLLSAEEKKVKAQVYANFARRMGAKGDYKAAIVAFKMAMEIDPKRRLEFLREYADQLSYNSEQRVAIPLYIEVLHANVDPETKLKAHLGLGRAYKWTNRYEEALLQFQKVLAIDPNNQDAIAEKREIYLNLTRDYAKKGNSKEAVIWFQKAIETDPKKRLELLREYADQLSYHSQAHLAIALYLEILNSNLDSQTKFYARLGLARAYMWRELFKESLEQYEIVLSNDPQNKEALESIAEIYLKFARYDASRGDHKMALHWFEEAMKKNPQKRREILREYADQLSFNSEANKAIAFYQEVIKANPSKENLLLARLGLARAYGWVGQNENALNEYREVLRLDPKNQDAHESEKKISAQIAIDFAKNMAEVKEHQEAVIWLKKAIGIDQNRRFELLRELADQLENSSQLQETIAINQEILNANPSSEQALFAHLGLARAYAKLEQYANATNEYRAVLAIDPSNREALKGIEPVKQEILEAQIKKRAEEEFAKALFFEKKLEVFQAICALKNSIDLDPNNKDYRIHYAWYLQNNRFLEEAIEQLCYIFPFFDDKRAIYQTLAWDLRELGKLQASLIAFSHIYNFSSLCNTYYQFTKISNCQRNENRAKKYRLICKILQLSDFGKIKFPSSKVDDLFACSLLQGCQKDPILKKLFLCRKKLAYQNFKVFQGVCLPAKGENKIELMKELLNVYSYTGEVEHARTLAQVLICIDPEDYQSYLLYLNALVGEKRYREVIFEYHALIKKLPNNAYLYFRLGEAYEKIGNLICAKHSYEMALNFDCHPRIKNVSFG